MPAANLPTVVPSSSSAEDVFVVHSSRLAARGRMDRLLPAVGFSGWPTAVVVIPTTLLSVCCWRKISRYLSCVTTNRPFHKSKKGIKKKATMGDEEDFAIESTDAGASATIPMEAGQIKKGG